MTEPPTVSADEVRRIIAAAMQRPVYRPKRPLSPNSRAFGNRQLAPREVVPYMTAAGGKR